MTNGSWLSWHLVYVQGSSVCVVGKLMELMRRLSKDGFQERGKGSMDSVMSIIGFHMRTTPLFTKRIIGEVTIIRLTQYLMAGHTENEWLGGIQDRIVLGMELIGTKDAEVEATEIIIDVGGDLIL